jgi:hypothetical protein
VGCGVAHGGFVGWGAMSHSGGGGFLGNSDGVGLWFFFFFFPKHFSECNQILEKKQFFLKSFTFKNILHWEKFYSKTNRALITIAGYLGFKLYYFFFLFFFLRRK